MENSIDPRVKELIDNDVNLVIDPVKKQMLELIDTVYQTGYNTGLHCMLNYLKDKSDKNEKSNK